MALINKETGTSLAARLARSFNTLVSGEQVLPAETIPNVVSDGTVKFSTDDFKRSQQTFDPMNCLTRGCRQIKTTNPRPHVQTSYTVASTAARK